MGGMGGGMMGGMGGGMMGGMGGGMGAMGGMMNVADPRPVAHPPKRATRRQNARPAPRLIQGGRGFLLRGKPYFCFRPPPPTR
jgi:hypothetical protein